MIYKLTGKIEQVDDNQICITTSAGVGYEVNCTLADIQKFTSDDKEKTVYTYLQVREDAFVLFGFSSLNIKAMFLKLISISGIGPKMAISILSDISTEDLAYSIVNGDVKALSSVKGLGKKTAERIILELKEKVHAVEGEIKKDRKVAEKNKTAVLTDEQADSLVALCSLGLSRAQAEKLVLEYSTSDMKAEEIVTVCLKNMGAK